MANCHRDNQKQSTARANCGRLSENSSRAASSGTSCGHEWRCSSYTPIISTSDTDIAPELAKLDTTTDSMLYTPGDNVTD